MMPVLDDDALLYSLDDIADEQLPVKEDKEEASGSVDPADRAQELERELSRLRGEFAEYKNMVTKSLEKDINEEDGAQGPSLKRFERAEDGYFSSYSYNSKYGHIQVKGLIC